MVADVVELLGAQGSRLVEDRLSCADLSHVVKAARQTNLLYSVFIESHFLRYARGEVCDALRMTAQVRVLRFERVHEGLHDVDAEGTEGEFIALELCGPQRHLFANEALDIAPLDGQPTPVKRA